MVSAFMNWLSYSDKHGEDADNESKPLGEVAASGAKKKYYPVSTVEQLWGRPADRASPR
jgi:hypothetical protein